ncbi:ABC-type multidrug transport system, ATPase and permease component [Halalkaliarchaeum sp. AArc-CO]|uniref:ABC transporter ATP-binding protein n=1 Tax=unclassified Halalkaliarchaeum TaxID=2678344 RepID=UPI00217E5A41|nr:MULTISPECIES: ABC transporter ATP-binding protein [unclassified Halalkaliarchaeum]MDR5672234.1 ABC transporter ATP-binding protein [Halalkaliarchaeum sp. AArc-GB]UWG50158.1 ABC-type multidrug transport system, ATPase and permease component [Halalkaliarchaeum sp. AArc-CO]
MVDDIENVSRREKLNALLDVARFDPKFTLVIVSLGLLAAALEGVGLSFILPIIEIVQLEDPVAEADGFLEYFVLVYQTLGIPFTLGYVVVGVTGVMIVRYTTTFLVGWFQAALTNYYIRDLQNRAYGSALNAHVAYFDEEGSDDILNAIITETRYGARVIRHTVRFMERLFLSLVYLLIALIISPLLTLMAIGILGFLTVFLRWVVEPGYELGDIVADANERRQEAAQAGTQGVRDVRIFNLTQELFEDFTNAVDRYTRNKIKLRRNEAAISSFYNLGVAVSVFVLIYLALTLANLSIGALGVFLFAMYQLGPKVSSLNKLYYKIENNLPHLIRTQTFIKELNQREEVNNAETSVPNAIRHVEFDDVWFSYDDEESVLKGVDFEVEKGEFVAFVGQSGAGKSTIVSLLARLYRLDHGVIRANGIPIDEMDINEWRERIAVVRQSPFIFNDTLEYNLTIGNRTATRNELDRACRIAKVDEFFEELPNGYDSQLGDDGVRLSGGQKQRVALARALLTDADLLLLDEATSDLDSHLEQKVQRAIEAMDRDYAMIAIAHRLSTVENADRIYTMEDGEITEVGTHQELINQNGRYANLYAIQS